MLLRSYFVDNDNNQIKKKISESTILKCAGPCPIWKDRLYPRKSHVDVNGRAPLSSSHCGLLLPSSSCGVRADKKKTCHKHASDVSLWSLLCKSCTRSPCSSIHRVTHTPTPPWPPDYLEENTSKNSDSRFPVSEPPPPLCVPLSSVPPLLIIFTLALLRIQALPLSRSSLSSHSSSCLQPPSTHRFKYTLHIQPSTFSLALHFLCPLNNIFWPALCWFILISPLSTLLTSGHLLMTKKKNIYILGVCVWVLVCVRKKMRAIEAHCVWGSFFRCNFQKSRAQIQSMPVKPYHTGDTFNTGKIQISATQCALTWLGLI